MQCVKLNLKTFILKNILKLKVNLLNMHLLLNYLL